jgi:hypothetical protein
MTTEFYLDLCKFSIIDYTVLLRCSYIFYTVHFDEPDARMEDQIGRFCTLHSSEHLSTCNSVSTSNSCIINNDIRSTVQLQPLFTSFSFALCSDRHQKTTCFFFLHICSELRRRPLSNNQKLHVRQQSTCCNQRSRLRELVHRDRKSYFPPGASPGYLYNRSSPLLLK